MIWRQLYHHKTQPQESGLCVFLAIVLLSLPIVVMMIIIDYENRNALCILCHVALLFQ